MSGKIVKISSNDLYGNVDSRKVAIYACFNHLKYMNKYLVFSYIEEDNTKKNKDKKLYYGSAHISNDTIICFKIKEDSLNYIDTFLNTYIEGTLNNSEYEIIDLSKIEKIQVVSSSNKDFDKLDLLEELTIKKEQKTAIPSKQKKQKPVGLYILLILLILSGIGITCLHFFPEKFSVEYKKLNCKIDLFDDNLNMPYTEQRYIYFIKNDKLSKIDVTNTYIFLDNNTFLEFKNNEKQNIYFNIDGTYKYDELEKSLKISYTEESIIDNYKEMLKYMKKEGYDCLEETYFK